MIQGKSERRGDDVLISCPFHSDSTPSCHLNDGMWAYNCFGCRGGNFLNFRHRFLTEVVGEEISWYQMIDRMLREDAILSAKLGYGTIYVQEERAVEELIFLTQNRFTAVRQLPKTYLEVVDKFLQTNPTVEKKKLFILLMQKEVPVKDVWSEFFGRNESAGGVSSAKGGSESCFSEKHYDLEELNQL